jgi:hypothetical protein
MSNEPVTVTSSLTAPRDRTQYRTKPDVPPLSYDETKRAVEDLYVPQIPYFPTERHYKDPQYSNQNFCLVSFVPAKGASPDPDGFFGFIKVRGVFATTEEASQRAEWLIQNADSYHKIYTATIGAPFPMVADAKQYAKEDFEVQVKKSAEKTINQVIKEKDAEDKRELETIKEREAKLLKDSKIAQESPDDYKVDPLEKYTMNQVKRAQLIWTYKETVAKLAPLRNNIRNASKEILEMDSEYPDFYNQFYEKYMESRRQVGLTDEKVAEQGSFIKYMVGDVKLDFDVLSEVEPVDEGSYGQVGQPLRGQ